MTIRTVIICFVVTMLRLNSAHADAHWTMNAASCRSSPDNINSKSYEVSSGAVRHAPGSTSQVTLWCPVIASPETVAPTNVTMLRFATNRNGFDASATVALIKKNLHSGKEETLVHFTNSDTLLYNVKCGLLNENIQYEDDSGAHPQNYVYYVRIDMVRSSTATQDTVYWVDLNDGNVDRLCSNY